MAFVEVHDDDGDWLWDLLKPVRRLAPVHKVFFGPDPVQSNHSFHNREVISHAGLLPLPLGQVQSSHAPDGKEDECSRVNTFSAINWSHVCNEVDMWVPAQRALEACPTSIRHLGFASVLAPHAEQGEHEGVEG